jgi:F420-non-reducing hydrogenase iron-sulfur subunit
MERVEHEPDGFRPKIVGFLCNWCAYSGADLAGVSRVPSSPCLRVIRVMCTGRVDPGFVFKAFSSGADGVLLAGCHPGDCHYQEGNYKCLRRFLLIRQTLEGFGIDPMRVRLEWISASEGDKYARVSREMEAEIRALGPLRLAGAVPAPAPGGIDEQAEARVVLGS